MFENISEIWVQMIKNHKFSFHVTHIDHIKGDSDIICNISASLQRIEAKREIVRERIIPITLCM